MDETDVEILERKTVFRGYFRIDAYRLRHRLFAGGWSHEFSREVFERGHAVAVLLYDPARDAVIMIEQFRVGALAAGKPPWVRELVAGIIDEAESPEDVARREALEEAGCTIGEMLPVAQYMVSPGCSSETVRIFAALVDSGGVGGIHGLAEEHEDIRVSVVPWIEIRADLAARRFDNAITIVGLQWLALNRERLRPSCPTPAPPPALP